MKVSLNPEVRVPKTGRFLVCFQLRETPIDRDIAGRHVIVVEDIVDSGLTLQYLLRNLGSRNPKTLEVCALLTKPDRRKVDLPTRYVGFEIADRFVVGYGLDYAERYRNLPFVAALES